MPNWTKNQEDAIRSTGGSVLVSASAGSGKTAVLVERVIQRLTDKENPVSADRLLIVTYTKAASAEMKERIDKALSALIKKNPYDTFLRTQQIKLKRAYISTIHSFCSELIKENFYLLGISRDFRIADDGEVNTLKIQAIEDVLNKQYEVNNNENFLDLVESFSDNKNDERLKQVVFKLYDFLRSHPFPEYWLKEKLSYYDTTGDLSHIIWVENIYSQANFVIDYAESTIKCILASPYCNKEYGEVNPEMYSNLEEKLVPILINDLVYLDKLKYAIDECSWDDIREVLYSFNPQRLPQLKKIAGEDFKNFVSGLRDEYKNSVKSLLKYFPVSEKVYKTQMEQLQPIVAEMFNLVVLFGYRLDELKAEQNVQDFSDLEHLALKLLVKNVDGVAVPTEEAKKIADKFDEVMVDEYQDANEVQDTIFKAVSGGEKNLFVVGDVKQSIYSFRQAMPEIFIKRSEVYPKFNRENPFYPAKIILEKNFRSRQEITDSVNFMFNLLMTKHCGDVEYTDDEQLVCGASYDQAQTNKVSLSVIQYNKESYDDACVQEADYIAGEIYRIINEGYVWEKGHQRKPVFSDFAVLLRSSNSSAPVYVNRLKEWGIPATSAVSDSFLTKREISIIYNLLKIIDNPVQDIPLLAVMMSPIYGFTADDVSEIRINDKRVNLYTSLTNSANKGNEKAKRFLQQLNDFRTYSVAKPVHLLINKIYEDTSYPAILYGIYKSDFPVNNILLFKEYAYDYENNGYKGVSSFVNYLDNIISQGGDLPAGDTSNGDVNAVNVMSIHRSKGLEFPFVFLANTNKRFVNDTTDNVLIHKDMGFTLKLRNHQNHTVTNTVPRVASALKITENQKSEELRVLYVALTRAREELHMLCTVENPERYVKKCSSKIFSPNRLTPYVVQNSGCIADWLVYCGLIHPNGYKLRHLAGLSFSEDVKYNYAPDWDFNIVTEVHSLEENTQSINKDTVSLSEDTDNSIEEIIKTRFDFQYKNTSLNDLPVKIAVSEISHNKSKEIFKSVLARPDFMSEKSMTATQRGTAVHNVLQHIDFKKAKENLDNELNRLTDMGFITSAERSVVDKATMIKFLNSEIVEDVLASPKVYREFRFNTIINAGSFMEDIPDNIKEKEVIMQGAVDLAYVKDNSLVIVDYKTDRVKNLQDLRELYTSQVTLYKSAMEQCTPYKVSKCLIYSVRLGDYIEI
jgi:ATP-dependent helicase/nuclease subunit A